MLFTTAPVLLALSLLSSSVLAAPAPRTGAAIANLDGSPRVPAKRSVNQPRGGSHVRRQPQKAASNDDITAMLANTMAAGPAADGAVASDSQIQQLIDALTGAQSKNAGAGQYCCVCSSPLGTEANLRCSCCLAMDSRRSWQQEG